MNSDIDDYISKANSWQQELEQLRMILLDCQLTEVFKWRAPCYTYKNKNIAILASFKDSCALSFFKGVLLNDAHNILVAPGENSQSARFIKFTQVEDIIEMEPILKAYIYEAIEVEKAGLKVDFKAKAQLKYPEELQKKLNEIPAFKIAFDALTPGRQRAYNLYFSAAKQSKTRESRIEKYMERILDGKGLNDCICGLSKKPPNCDGSHKYIGQQT